MERMSVPLSLPLSSTYILEDWGDGVDRRETRGGGWRWSSAATVAARWCKGRRLPRVSLTPRIHNLECVGRANID